MESIAVILAVSRSLAWPPPAGGGTRRIPSPIEWQGYAEADFVKVGPTQQGLLTAVSSRAATRWTAGAPLFDQDDTADRAALDQAARQLGQAEAQLANLQSTAASRPRFRQAQANLADAQAARDKA